MRRYRRPRGMIGKLATAAALSLLATVVPVGAVGAAPGLQPPETALVAGSTSIQAAVVPPSAPVENATIVTTWDVSALVPASIDPAGITYVSHLDRILFSDSEVDEEPTVYEGANLFAVSRLGALIETGRSYGSPLEPTGLSYNPTNHHLFISNDNAERIYEVDPGGDGMYGTADDIVSSFSTAAFGSIDPEDVAYDTHTGALFLSDGIGREVFRVDPGPNGILDGVDGDDVVTSFDLGPDGIEDAEGIGYRESSRTLLVVEAASDESIYEYTTDGFLLRRIDLDAIQILGVPETPSDVVVAPASDESGAQHLYLVDRKSDNGDPNDEFPPPMDGTIYELTAPFTDLAPYVDAGDDSTTTLSLGRALDGFAVDDGQPTPGVVDVLWAKSDGPGDVTFGDTAALSTTASFSVAGDYVLSLTATDGGGASTTDTVAVTVIEDPVDNTAPAVNAGADQVIVLADGAVLAGSAADDGMPDPPGSLSYQWRKLAGPGSVVFGSGFSPTTTVSFGTVGTYDLELRVSDGQLESSDVVRIVVEPNPPGTFLCTDNGFTGAGFTDVVGLPQATVDAIDCLVFFGISTGTGPTTFSPFDPVPRWQMALFLTRQAAVEGVALPSGADQGFTDIGHHPATTQLAINQLAQLGITQGTGSSTFDPDASVPRWQMALFLTRLLDVVGANTPSGLTGPFTDLDGLSAEAVEAINRLWSLEIARGTSSTTFAPHADVARWQMALFLIRTLDVGGFG